MEHPFSSWTQCVTTKKEIFMPGGREKRAERFARSRKPVRRWRPEAVNEQRGNKRWDIIERRPHRRGKSTMTEKGTNGPDSISALTSYRTDARGIIPWNVPWTEIKQIALEKHRKDRFAETLWDLVGKLFPYHYSRQADASIDTPGNASVTRTGSTDWQTRGF